MIVDELILKLQADLGDIKKSLKQVEADAAKSGKEAGAKMGKEAGTSFGDVFNAIAGAAVLNTVKGFFSKAAQEFNKMEAAMMRVDSIAKGFGRSVEGAKKQVNELADKGFLNLNQAASSYADAIALGFDEKQARKFIDALSDVAAFQNTIGDGAAAVQSGVSGLLSNSAEKVENIGVPIKVLNMAYNENIKTMGKAAALQKFYNGILKESEKFQGDAARSTQTLAGAQASYNAAVEKSFQAVGKKLEPALKSLYQIGTQVANWLADMVGKLDSTTVAVVAFGTLAYTSILTFAKGAAALPAVFGSLGASITAALGPIGLFIAAVGGAIIIVNKLRREWGDSAARDLLKQRDALIQQIGALQESGKKTKELSDAKAKLNEINKQLIATYANLLKFLDAENLSLEKKIEIIDKLEKAEKRLTADKDLRDRSLSELTGKSKELESEFKRGAAALASGAITRERYDEELAKVAAEKAIIDAEIESRAGTGGAKPATAASFGKRGPEARFIEARDQLKKLKNEYTTYLRIERDGAKREEASTKYFSARRAIEADLRGAIAEYNEETVTAQQEAAKREYEDQVKRIYELANIDENAKKRVAEDLQKAQESYARQNAQIYAESFARTMQGANAIASGFAGVARAQNIGQALGGFGGIAQGIGGLSERFKSFGVIGQGIAAAGGIISTLTDLFGKSDAERAREAEEQKRRDEEAKALLELQANYQKGMLALQEAAAKLPFENLQRNLRLVDIQSQKQILSGADQSTVDASRLSQKQAILQGVLSGQSGEISKGEFFAGTQATPDALIQFLSERAAQSLAIQQFVKLMGSFQSAFRDGVEDPGYWNAIYSQIESYRGKVPDKFFSYLDPLLRSRNEYVAGFSGTENRGNFIRGLSATFGLFDSEITSDTSIAENLLSVIEQSQQIQLDIAGNTKKTADNTSKALELRPDRERSFIDVGLGFMQSLGQRITSPSGRSIAASLSQQNFSIPAEIGAASVTSSRARTLQERMADALEMQLMQGATANDILRDIRALTYDLLAVMDGDASTGASFSQQDFINFSSDVKRRRI